jgi:hypothetical protein
VTQSADVSAAAAAARGSVPDEEVGPGEELDVEVLGVKVFLDPGEALGVGGHARAGQHPPPTGAVPHVVLGQHVDRLRRDHQEEEEEDEVVGQVCGKRRERWRGLAYASVVVGEADVADVVGLIDSVNEQRLARLVVTLLPILHLSRRCAHDRKARERCHKILTLKLIKSEKNEPGARESNS